MNEFPVKKAVIVSISVLAFFLLTFFFLVSFTRAETDVRSSGANFTLTHTECQVACQEFLGMAYNYDSCEDFKKQPAVQGYIKGCLSVTGPCSVSTREGVCIIQ